MSEINFSRNVDNPATAVTETETPVPGVTVPSITTVAPAVYLTGADAANAAPAEAAACAVPAVIHQSPSGLILGDKIPDFNDIILPRLNLVQNIGDLKDSFAPGCVVYNQTSELYHPQLVNKQTGAIIHAGTAPLAVICLGFRPTRFAEKTEGGIRGSIVNSEAEVRAAGGTLSYQEHALKKSAGMKRFEQLAEALMLIERPAHIADDDMIFNYAVEGRKYALALWAMKGTAFTAAAKKVFFTQRAMGCLKAGGYPSHTWTLATRSETYDSGNTAWIPVVLPKEKTGPALLEFIRGVLNGS